ncbi:MAG: hypothetical protein A2901_07155 [Elusimicrobia bacterium RIFCSPLOWO2_01_FULL_54_10]|nr:MAG: hypothetical protein A2901_07155 [Elusimicrobia bacterium RIFCSPLOWO2_01_FULL_54_10]
MPADYRALERIARREFGDILRASMLLGKRSQGSFKLRLALRDTSFIDIWLSSSGKYSYHWERRRQTGRLYRFDNAPHHPRLSTHPHHLHDEVDRTIRPSRFPRRPADQLRFVLKFARERF